MSRVSQNIPRKFWLNMADEWFWQAEGEMGTLGERSLGSEAQVDSDVTIGITRVCG